LSGVAIIDSAPPFFLPSFDKDLQIMANTSLNPDRLPVALVLQGGGALGAYQAGVYQALHEKGLLPDWVVGTSIGAINACLIAGNEPGRRLQRLKAFWDTVAHPDCVDLSAIDDNQRRAFIRLNTIDILLRGAPGFFEPRLFNSFALGLPVEPERASFYDTSVLDETLEALVDFDYLNSADAMRLTVNAIKVTSGLLAHFDSAHECITAEHIRASGSLPPGFPPVRIDGELYWDGGLYSNTPLESVLNKMPPGDRLCFMVDLWSPQGEEPQTLDEVTTRQKDVTFASRSERHIADYIATQKMQRTLRQLYARLPQELHTAEDEAELAALGCESTLHIVHLRYAGRDWHMAAKDVNFSKGSIEWRWEQGYNDAQRAITHAAWRRGVAEGTVVVVHEMPGHDAAVRQAD
jgi:NTE family protein